MPVSVMFVNVVVFICVNVAVVSSHDGFGLLTNCYHQCGNKGGYCPEICGENALCCRKGHPDCPDYLAHLNEGFFFKCISLNSVKEICNGRDDSCCTKEHPCAHGEGDCNNDLQCFGSLICGINNCAWGDYDDCCTNRNMLADSIRVHERQK